MFFPRNHTVLLATFDCVARVDLREGESLEVVHCWRQSRSDSSELRNAVAAALGLGAARCGRVYVLSDELWSGAISLSDEIVSAVPQDQLEQTLALEAEYDSAIPPFESRLGYMRLSSAAGHSTYWVAQADPAQLQAISAAIPNAAGRLVAVSSAAAIPHPQADSAPQPTDTSTADACAVFAQNWLRQYLAHRQEVAAIDVARPGPAQHQRHQRASISLAVAVLMMCLLLHRFGSGQLARAEDELSKLAARQQQVQAEINQSEQHARQLREISEQHRAAEQARTEQIAELARQRAAVAEMRKHPAQLLRALAATAHSDHWIQGIYMRQGQAVISGLAVDSTSVATLAQRLETALGAPRWLVRAAELSPFESTPLVHFEMVLVPVAGKHVPINVASSRGSDAH